MTQFDYSKFSDKKLHQLYTTFSLMGDSKQHQGKPAVGVVKEGLLQELKRRGLKNEADEKSNAPKKPKEPTYDLVMIGKGSDPSRDEFKGRTKDSLKYYLPKGWSESALPEVGQTKVYKQDFGDGEVIEYHVTRKNSNEADEKSNANGSVDALKKKIEDARRKMERDIEKAKSAYAHHPDGEQRRKREIESHKAIFEAYKKLVELSISDLEKENEADENKCNATLEIRPHPKDVEDLSPEQEKAIRERFALAKEKSKNTTAKEVDIAKKALEKAKSDKNIDPRILQRMRETYETKLRQFQSEKGNSKENAMDKVTAMKKKILLSNASDAVKAKALKKLIAEKK